MRINNQDYQNMLSISATANSKLNKLNDNDHHHRVTFFNFFLVQDGVISFSLRDLTITCTFIISISFLSMLYGACTEGKLECSFEIGNLKIPMISDVVALPFYDRIFILLNTIYFMGVHQVNVRAFYKRLSDAGVSEGFNDFLFYCGIISCISLPLIGVFDCHNFKHLHYFCAGLFFISAGTYLFSIANQMYINKGSFPP
jgi:Frag1/DRAM/Sfk1 family